MNLMRWDPVREPIVDIEEGDQEYHITAELPGLRKEDVKITLQEGVLTLQGERKQEREEKGRRMHRIERSYGAFVRRGDHYPLAVIWKIVVSPP